MSQASDAYHTPVQPAGQKKEDTFLVRIVSLDYYMAKPLPGLDMCFSQLEGTAIERVPVVQVYGSTPGGQKTCVHLHKAFPYFYVPYDTDFPAEPLQAQAFVRHFARALESAMHAGLELGAQRHQRVFAVQLVRATPYYGYQRDEALFLKIIMYNPTDVGRAAKLLQGGGVVGKNLQPYEAHVPFLLQLKIDLNLAGMGWLHLSQVNCRVPFPERLMHRRRGWRDTPTLIQYEPDAPPGSGLSISEGTLAASQQDKLWVVDTLPTQWTVPVQTAAGPGRMLEKRSTCELEADACIEHVLNRTDLVRDKLEDVGPDKRMVESLAPMWDEERHRCGGTGPPDPPPDPLRNPQPLCATVDFVRSQFQAVADAHAAEVDRAMPDRKAAPPSEAEPGDSPASPAERPSCASAASASASQRELLQQTQAANRVIPSEGMQSPNVPEGVYDEGNLFVDPGQNMPEIELQAADIVQREDLDTAMEQDLAGERPAVALQEGHEDEERHLRQLMDLMHHEDSCSDEETEGHARLMALAAQVATQRGPSQPISQADVLNKQLERAASQAEEECQAILAAPGASRPASAAATSEASHASEAPRKQPRSDKPSMEEDQPIAQDRVLEDIEALGDIPPHMGPQEGGNVTWDGGGSPAAVAVSSLRDQLGVFEGYSDNDNFNWSLISSVRPQAHAESPEHSPAHSSPEGDRHIPQTDGAGDESLSADSVSGPDLPDLNSQDANEADSQTRPRRHAGTAEAGQQRLASAGSQSTQGGSQRFGGLALQAASPSFKSALEPDRFVEHSPNGSQDAKRSRSMASMVPAGRRKPPHNVRPLKLDSSDGSRHSSGRLPGQYRPPVSANTGSIRAPFRPPRPVIGTAAPGAGSAQLDVAGLHQPGGVPSVASRGLGQYSMVTPPYSANVSDGSQPLMRESAAHCLAPVHDLQSPSHQQEPGYDQAEVTLQHRPAHSPGDDLNTQGNPVDPPPATGQLRAARAHMRARRRPQLEGPVQHESEGFQPAPDSMGPVAGQSVQEAERLQHPQHNSAVTSSACGLEVGAQEAAAAPQEPTRSVEPDSLQPQELTTHEQEQLDCVPSAPADKSEFERRQKSQEFIAQITEQARQMRAALYHSTSSSEQRQDVADDAPGDMHADFGMDAASGQTQTEDGEPDIVVDLSSPSPLKQASAARFAAWDSSTHVTMDLSMPVHEAERGASQLGPAAVAKTGSSDPGMLRHQLMQASTPPREAQHRVSQGFQPEPAASPQGCSSGAEPSADIAIDSSSARLGDQQTAPRQSQPAGSGAGEAASPHTDRVGVRLEYRLDLDGSPVRLSLNLDLTASSKQTPPGMSAQAADSDSASPASPSGAAPAAVHSPPGFTPVPNMSADPSPAVPLLLEHVQGSASMQPMRSSHPVHEEHPTPLTAQPPHETEALQMSNVPLSALHPRGLFMSQAAGDAAGTPLADINASPQKLLEQAQLDNAAGKVSSRERQDLPGIPDRSGETSEAAVDRHSDHPDAVQPFHPMHDNQCRSNSSRGDSHGRESLNAPSQPLGSPVSVEVDLEEAAARDVQDDLVSLHGTVRGSGSKLYAFRPRGRPPNREELQGSMAEHGIPEILFQGVYYGNPADVPERPIVWAGLEFKVGSSATNALPPFRRGSQSSGPSAMEALKAAAQQQQQKRGPEPIRGPGRLWAFTPAQPPPSRAETDEWLARERAVEGSQGSNSSRSKPHTPGSTAHRPQVGVAFGMDANTGRLLPGQHGSSSQESGGSDLLETPALATLPSQNRPGPGPSRLRVATQQSSGNEQQEEEEEIRPASPKYDERSFFYTTPKLNPARPALQRPVTTWATPNAALNPTHAEAMPCPLQTPAAAVPPSPRWADRVEVPGTPETPMLQVRPLMPPPLFDAAHASGTSAAHAAQQPSHGAQGAAASAAAPAAMEDIQAKARKMLGEPAIAKRWTSQITPPSPAVRGEATPVSQAGFRRLIPGKGQNLTLLSIELHADTRGTLLPDPRYDALRCIVLAAADDAEDMSDGNYTARVLLFYEKTTKLREGLPNVQMEAFESENALLDAFVEAVRALDPDILVGFEVQQGSLGYLVDRASTLERPDPLLRQLSRTPQVSSSAERRNDDYGQLHASGLHCHGRVVLNLWRLLRSELKLRIYTFESCVAAVLQLRTPHIPAWVLAQWFTNGPGGGRWRCVQYWVRRARLSLAMMEQLDMTGRTGELARAFGIDFFSVLTRGSQYRVEAMMVRLAHTQNYLLPAPSKQQCTGQPAMEAIPLVMEPESRLYVDPVIVLDFQSLYPSQIIAYNLCYSTCLGRPSHATAGNAPIRLGAQTYGQEKGIMRDSLSPEKLIIAPNGVAYAPPEARHGILPRLLQEILSTRIMVKAAMKRAPKSAKVLQRILNARQFGLKLIANVTYGYTAAGFSGRMPCAELADSIVQLTYLNVQAITRETLGNAIHHFMSLYKHSERLALPWDALSGCEDSILVVQSARETLENAIRMVEAHPRWRARVVYGDTDSLFVLLPGRSREEAFQIGSEIAAAATAANPPPVTLKMEKVYHPCVLLAKKRYVGFMYESPKQATPTFDAKGIETVRRDTCGAVAKMMERTLRILFTSKDLSQVKEYVQRQWTKILAGRVSLADFVFAKEVRLGTYSARHGIVPPAAIVAGKAMASDPRMEPRYGERVPYVVVYGEPGARLIDMVVSPHALLESQGRLRLHANYYITKQIIPALERVISLVGADMRAWFATMPRPQRLLPQKRPAAALGLGGRSSAGTIDAYYLSRHCAVCDGLTHAQRPLCEACRAEPQAAASVLAARSMRLSGAHALLVKVCLHCGGGGGRLQSRDGIVCDSLDCGVFFERRKAAGEAAAAEALCQAALALF